ncbi:TetR/AcrR family transcriptional regulator [Streptomyces sp. 8K308]|uniref:TetR/AcrR family transcriptional regulator n=1 Tax=Streptomyces sp. 8K308 TaxID=2530388 RepID=UPI001FB5C011|nr:TetR/AcrR family transcriptional regulator [Streptomyces sp. 8K308]
MVGRRPAGKAVTGGGTLRADARQNRARILESAETVFDAQGPSASTEEIARKAGVAIGTVFRHFPTKAALVEAVFVGRLARLATHAEKLAESEEAGVAFFDFFTTWAELSAAKHSFADALADEGVDVRAAAERGPYPAVRRELAAAVETLLTRAQAAGAVRADIGMPELNALLIGVARAVEQVRDAPAVRRRLLGAILDGLRRP